MSIISRRLRRLALAASVAGACLAGAGLVAPTLRDVEVPFAGGTLRIGSATLPGGIVGAALAQEGAVVLENLTLQVGADTYRIPRVEFTGVNLPRAELAELLSGGPGTFTAERLGRLQAREIRVPSLTLEQELGGQRQSAAYRDIVAGPVAGGRIERVAAAGGSVSITGPSAGTGTYGRITLEGLDLAHMVRVYGERAGGGPNEMKPLYAAFTIEGVRFSDARGGQAAIGRIAGGDFRARLGREPWADLSRRFAEATKPGAAQANPGEMIAAMTDLYESVSFGSFEIVDLQVQDPAKPDGGTGRIGRIAVRGGEGGETRLEGLDFGSPEATLRVATISSRGFSFAPVLAGLKDFAAKPDQEMTPALLRRFVPDFGTTRISGVSVESKAPGGPGAVSIREIEVAAARPRNGIPTDLRFGLENVAFTLPADAEDDNVKALIAMGYKAVDLTLRASASWQEGGNELVLREVLVQGRDMGKVLLAGTLGNVTKDVFDPDEAVAMVALLEASAKTIDLTVDNDGLLEKYVAQEARKQKKTPEAVRKEYGTAASVGIPAILGGAPDAKALAQALARFVAKPDVLTVRARSKDPAGLGIADVMGITAPAQALDQVQIQATAN